MTPYNFEYKSFEEILNISIKVQHYSLSEWFIFLGLLIFLYLYLHYFSAFIHIYFKERKNEQLKQTKKNLIKEMILQKDINHEIEQELQELNNK